MTSDLGETATHWLTTPRPSAHDLQSLLPVFAQLWDLHDLPDDVIVAEILKHDPMQPFN